MTFFGRLFGRRKNKKREKYADQQYLDAIDILRESMDTYLDLLADARQDDDQETCGRLEAKLNNNLEHYVKSWDGEYRISYMTHATCSVSSKNKRLKLE